MGVTKIEIFKLFGSIMVDNDEANKSISKTDEKAEGLGTKLGKGIKTAAKWGAALGAGAAVVGAGMFKMASSSAETTDRIDKLSQKIGMSRQGFQEMDFIASQSGMSIESLQVGFKTLRGSMEQAEKGTGKGAEAFKALGISVKDANGDLRNQEEVFNEAVNKLQSMEDGTEKAMLATQLFGKSGQELMPLLNGAAGSMDEMRQQAHDLGLVLSDESIDAGVAFTDTMDQLQRSFQAAVAEIGVHFMPMITSFADFIIANMPTIQNVIQTAFDIIGSVISFVVDWIQTLMSWMGQWKSDNEEALKNIWENFKEKLTLVWEFVKEAFETIKKVVSVIMEDVTKFLRDKLDVILKFWKDNGESISKAVENVFKFIWEIIKFIMPTVTTIIKVAWDLIKQIFDSAIGIIMGLVQVLAGILTGDFTKIKDGLLKIWKSLWNLIKGVVEGAWDLLSGVFGGLWTSISSWFTGLKDDALQWGKNMIQGFIDGIFGMIDKVKNAVTSVMNVVGDFLGFNSPAKKGEGRNIVKWGRNMVSGFLDGVDEEGKKLGVAISDIVGSVEMGTSDGSIFAKFKKPDEQTSSSNPIVYHIHNVNIDGRTVAIMKHAEEFFTSIKREIKAN